MFFLFCRLSSTLWLKHIRQHAGFLLLVLPRRGESDAMGDAQNIVRLHQMLASGTDDQRMQAHLIEVGASAKRHLRQAVKGGPIRLFVRQDLFPQLASLQKALFQKLDRLVHFSLDWCCRVHCK